MIYPTIRQEIDNRALEAGKDCGLVLLIDLKDGQEVVRYRRRYRSFAAMRAALAGAHKAIEAAQ